MTPDPHPTRADGHRTRTFEPDLDAGLAAAFGPDPTPGGWSQPPLLRDDPSDHSPIVRPSPGMPRAASGRYLLLGEIARGGMGVVLKGRDPDLGRDLAVKVLRSDLVGRPAAVQRFVEEAQVCGQLQHPGVVPVYDLGRLPDGRPFFAMKLVRGRTLADLLAERKEPADGRGRFLQVFLQVCQTVAYAHAVGVVHRDLKPSNVMVGGFGEVQVMDWGLAKVLPRGGVADERKADPAGGRPVGGSAEIRTARSGGGSETVVGSVMGTPAFMSPEQAAGEVDRLDERTDVFGLGAVLCVILTGLPPSAGPTPSSTGRAAGGGGLDEAVARLAACGADAEVTELCRRCLAADRDARPRDAGEVARAVTAYLAEVEGRAHRAEVARAVAEAMSRRLAEEKAASERKRRRALAALKVAVGLLLLGVGVAPLFMMWSRETRYPHLAIDEAPPRVSEAVARAEAAEARAAADRAKVALALEVQAGDRDRAMAAYREAVRLAPADAAVHGLLGELLLRTGDLPGARAALTEAARLDPGRWGPALAKLPPVPVAPPPRPKR